MGGFFYKVRRSQTHRYSWLRPRLLPLTVTKHEKLC